MKCPKCNASTNRGERGNVLIDFCELCSGIWLDKDELEKLVAYKGTDKDVEKLKSLLSKDTEVVAGEGISCPACNKIMQKVKFMTPDNIIADKCAACQGIWFDAGELISVTDFVKSKTITVPEKKEANFSVVSSILGIVAIVALFSALVILVVKFIK